MDQATNGTVERTPGVARWLAISTGVVVLLALPAVFVMAIPRSGELGGLLIVPAVGLLVFELLVWWKPVVFSVTSRTVAPSVLFCMGAIASQVPWVVLLVTDLVLDSHLDIVSFSRSRLLLQSGLGFFRLLTGRDRSGELPVILSATKVPFILVSTLRLR